MKLKNILDDIKHLEEYAKICQVTWGDKKTDTRCSCRWWFSAR